MFVPIIVILWIFDQMQKQTKMSISNPQDYALQYDDNFKKYHGGNFDLRKRTTLAKRIKTNLGQF